ncbi:hypothetical protein [Paenibacillus sp. FSL R7-277]|uniref:hypothetical protein n=1 Tax=Paenibacillus sp. FSL R7-277 TaxID=1227352 RepID=UPI0004B12A8F|nr:hypothetical protein [Paenibacillus sp. FSL R7-277]
MSMSVHNLMAFNHQFFRPQPVVHPKAQRQEDKVQSFQEVLNEKLSSYGDKKK